MPAPSIPILGATPEKTRSGVDTKHPEYLAMQHTWEKMLDTCISEYHIHSKGETYLPRLDKMTDAQFAAYVRRAEFPLFTRHVLESFVGMAMRKDLLIQGLDNDHDFFKNCDGQGSSINTYAEKLVRNFLQYRRCGTLVEMPEEDPDMSVAEAEARNVKARFSFYDHASIINWKTKTQNNLNVITMIVLLEKEDVSTNEFEHRYEDRYRVLKLTDGVYTQEIYNHSRVHVKTIKPLKNNKPLNYIPFVIHGGVSVLSPVLLPIAEQNLHWYMKDADYQHGLHYTALPTPWVVGVSPTDEGAPSTIGPQELWMLPIGASCGMLEFNGAGLAEVSNSMNKTLSNITVLSSQILVPKSAFDETATAASIRSASETASLSALVSDLSAELTNLVTIASDWGNFAVEGTLVEINSDFIPLTLSGADVSAYVSSVLKEGFSKRTLFELLKRGEIIEGDRQYEEEMADIKADAEERKKSELDMAEALAKISAKLDSLTSKQDPDPKRTTGSSDADKASANSSRQKSSDTSSPKE